ncbi:malonyl-CoA O-methyltransferase [Paenibacillus catalpae]|uniref:Malonyl-[acyl-carrier protein] O-methyltransferase n=1 Tax=Paenibacillus catalpae TaxID=1045775 RepID=A0A1I1TXP4_9BACL|nr:malonyl-ACP O-methyltransferase BioC [Paenibacillus catalpae]SFD63284.1 malonyl-CoA O-methyltransferase [Paenibacillus catalpae]
MINRTTAIQRQFNRSADGSYDVHADVQRMMAVQLAKSLIERLGKRNTDGLKLLEVGCGTGALTEMLANQWPRASITALDIAPAMIKAAKQRNIASQSADLRFIQADVETWASGVSSDSFDLIVSSACFQWLSHPRQTLNHLRQILRPGGLLVFTTFGPETFRELHQAFEVVYLANGMKPQRHGLSFLSASQWNNVLLEAGFSNIHCQQETQMETYATPRAFLQSVKAMGASTSEANKIDGLSARRLFANMYKEYEERYSTQGGVVSTYELLLIEAE